MLLKKSICGNQYKGIRFWLACLKTRGIGRIFTYHHNKCDG